MRSPAAAKSARRRGGRGRARSTARSGCACHAGPAWPECWLPSGAGGAPGCCSPERSASILRFSSARSAWKSIAVAIPPPAALAAGDADTDGAGASEAASSAQATRRALAQCRRRLCFPRLRLCAASSPARDPRTHAPALPRQMSLAVVADARRCAAGARLSLVRHHALKTPLHLTGKNVHELFAGEF